MSDKAGVMAVRPCIRAHRNAFVAAMGIERETRNFRGVLASADASECGWVDRWMDDTVKKALV